MQLSELGQIRSKAYGRPRLSKERAKLVHNIMILRKHFAPGMKVFLFDSRLHLFPGKLKYHWTSPFVVAHAFSCGVIEIRDPTNGAK